VYDILDYIHKYLCNWTFNFRKVVQQQIWGEVVDFNLAFFSSSKNVTVITLLKSVHIYQSYCKKNLAPFFWPTLWYRRNVGVSVCLSDRLSCTRILSKDVSSYHKMFTDRWPRTLLLGVKDWTRNSNGFASSPGVKWDYSRKNYRCNH